MSESPKVYTTTTPKARKQHLCYECRRPIEKGETYSLCKGFWVDKWQEFRTCTACEDLRHELKDHGEYAAFGQLEEWATEAEETWPPTKETTCPASAI